MSLAKRLARLETASTGGEQTLFITHNLCDGKFCVNGGTFETEKEARAFVDGRVLVVHTRVPEPHPLPEEFRR